MCSHSRLIFIITGKVARVRVGTSISTGTMSNTPDVLVWCIDADIQIHSNSTIPPSNVCSTRTYNPCHSFNLGSSSNSSSSSPEMSHPLWHGAAMKYFQSAGVSVGVDATVGLSTTTTRNNCQSGVCELQSPMQMGRMFNRLDRRENGLSSIFEFTQPAHMEPSSVRTCFPVSARG